MLNLLLLLNHRMGISTQMMVDPRMHARYRWLAHMFYKPNPHHNRVPGNGYVPRPLTAVMIHPRVSLSIPVVSVVADIV